MNVSVLADWVRTPLHGLAVLAVLAGVLAFVLRALQEPNKRAPVAVVTAAAGAILCTAYSGDTSWRFAADHLGMASVHERVIMFAAGELALFAVAMMARENLSTTGAPGTPGVLVWVVTGVQVIPAFSESGVVAGTVRAFFGPAMAAVLWHLAMGIELRHSKPGAGSQSLPAVLAREARERLLSRLGLAVRGRDAAQIARDRWTRVATRRAAHLADLTAGSAKPWRLARARRRLAVAVDRTDAGVLPEQQGVLLDRIAAYRGAASLASMDVTAPWERQPEPEPESVVLERVPDPEVQPGYTYPQLPRAVPQVVPRGARMLPITARPGVPAPAVAVAAQTPRTRTEVHAEYVPEHEPEDDSPPPPAEDTLTARARADFLDALVDGRTPSIRDLKTTYSIGQKRAERIQSELKRYLP